MSQVVQEAQAELLLKAEPGVGACWCLKASPAFQKLHAASGRAVLQVVVA